MAAKERRAELRGAVNRADGTTIVGLAPQWLASNEVLQLLGSPSWPFSPRRPLHCCRRGPRGFPRVGLSQSGRSRPSVTRLIPRSSSSRRPMLRQPASPCTVHRCPHLKPCPVHRCIPWASSDRSQRLPRNWPITGPFRAVIGGSDGNRSQPAQPLLASCATTKVMDHLTRRTEWPFSLGWRRGTCRSTSTYDRNASVGRELRVIIAVRRAPGPQRDVRTEAPWSAMVSPASPMPSLRPGLRP
jgi:hypothetical protein